jgi:Crossover junction endodeoxyribonuclease RuvC
MQNKPITILGINPGARYLGIAIFHGAELRDWSVKVIKGEWSKEKMEKIKDIVSGLIEQHQPDVLAIKKLHSARSSDNLDSLVEELKRLAEIKKLPIYEYPIKFVEAFLSPAKKINKWKLAALMAEKYSALFTEWEKERTGKNSYYMRMFEAVFVAYVCFRQLDRCADDNPIIQSSVNG